jgi:hypothetical protein
MSWYASGNIGANDKAAIDLNRAAQVNNSCWRTCFATPTKRRGLIAQLAPAHPAQNV